MCVYKHSAQEFWTAVVNCLVIFTVLEKIDKSGLAYPGALDALINARLVRVRLNTTAPTWNVTRRLKLAKVVALCSSVI